MTVGAQPLTPDLIRRTLRYRRVCLGLLFTALSGLKSESGPLADLFLGSTGNIAIRVATAMPLRFNVLMVVVAMVAIALTVPRDSCPSGILASGPESMLRRIDIPRGRPERLRDPIGCCTYRRSGHQFTALRWRALGTRPSASRSRTTFKNSRRTREALSLRQATER